jgi:hypothetical protein
MMDIFEKQQNIEAIKTVVKARWFYVLIVVGQAAIVKLFFPHVPLPNNPLISLVVGGVLLFNFGCWFYLRRPPEKIGDRSLKIVKFFQVASEQIALTAFFYFSGTANKLLIILYIVPIMVGTILYKAKGIIFCTLSTFVLYTGLVFLEYFGLMPLVFLEAASQGTGKLLRGETGLIKSQIIGFNLYMLAASIYAGYIAGLFRKREKNLIGQKKELVEKTKVLTQTKDRLQSALVKSDMSRRAATKAREEMERANVEMKKKVQELERFYRVTVGREVKMEDLKSEIKKLRETIKKLEIQAGK